MYQQITLHHYDRFYWITHNHALGFYRITLNHANKGSQLPSLNIATKAKLCHKDTQFSHEGLTQPRRLATYPT